MRTRKRRIETHCETTTILILKYSKDESRLTRCEQCGAEVIRIKPAEIDPCRIPGLTDGDAVHTKDGLFVCASLFQELKKGENP